MIFSCVSSLFRCIPSHSHQAQRSAFFSMNLRENLQETNQSMDCFQEHIGNMFSLILRKYSFHYFRKQWLMFPSHMEVSSILQPILGFFAASLHHPGTVIYHFHWPHKHGATSVVLCVPWAWSWTRENGLVRNDRGIIANRLGYNFIW